MADPAPAVQVADPMTSERYLRLVDEGVLGPDDRVELLEGVIVAMAPHSPRHAAGIQYATEVLLQAVAGRATLRCQLALVAGAASVPEPDIAILPGNRSDYAQAHPRTALLVVEVAESSLPQDRLTKSAIYAAAGIPEYWIANLRDDRLEVSRNPVPGERRYAENVLAFRGDTLELTALPGVRVAVGDLLPPT